MSIINEALKKAREKREREIQPPLKPLRVAPPGVTPPEEEAQRDKTKAEAPKDKIRKTDGLSSNQKPALRIILLVTGVVVLIFFALPIMVRQSINRTVNRSLATEEKDAALPQPLKNLPDQAAAELPERPEFILTGIVADKDSPMAIINGEVYMVGEKVKTAKVLKISEDVVVLEKDGEKIELKVR